VEFLKTVVLRSVSKASLEMKCERLTAQVGNRSDGGPPVPAKPPENGVDPGFLPAATVAKPRPRPRARAPIPKPNISAACSTTS